MSYLKLNVGAATTAVTDKLSVYADTTDNLLKTIDENSVIRALGQNALASIVADTAAINTTETIVVGGLNNARIYANQFKAGTIIRATLRGTCTSSAANASTWRFRFGTAGTTSDGILGAASNSVAAASGTNIPFVCTMVFTVRTIGAAGTITGFITLQNTGVTGISAVTLQTVALTPTAIDTTLDRWLSVTYVAAAATTTSTFQDAFIEVVKA